MRDPCSRRTVRYHSIHQQTLLHVLPSLFEVTLQEATILTLLHAIPSGRTIPYAAWQTSTTCALPMALAERHTWAWGLRLDAPSGRLHIYIFPYRTRLHMLWSILWSQSEAWRILSPGSTDRQRIPTESRQSPDRVPTVVA